MEAIRTGTDTVDLLSDLAHLLNLFGPGSPEVETFLGSHPDNAEFLRLGRLSCALKRALTADAPMSTGPDPDHIDIARLSPTLESALQQDLIETTSDRTRDAEMTQPSGGKHPLLASFTR